MPPRVKWSICLLLFGATLLNYLDRQTLSVSAPALAAEMHLTDNDLGRLFFGFLLAYGVAQLFLGPLLDRFRTVPTYAAVVVAWSVMGASSALATGFVSLFVARMMLGIFESPNWPLALRITARIIPPSQRSLAIGIFQSGTSIGALVAPPLIIALTQNWGWRTAFAVCGAAGGVWTLLWLAVTRESARQLDQLPAPAISAEAPPSSAAKSPATLSALLRSRAFWGLLLASVLVNPLQYLYTSWLPRYFTTYAGVEFGRGLAARLVLAYLALDLGLWLGGGSVPWLARRFGVVRARLLVAGIGMLAMSVIPLAAVTHSLPSITALICISMFGLGCFLVNYLSFLTEVSVTRVALVAGLLGGAGSLAGAGFMLVVGHTVESTKSFDLTFIISGLLPAAAFAGLWLCATALGRPRADHAPTMEVAP